LKNAFIANLRSLAEFQRQPRTEERRIAIEHSYSLREKINTNFDKVRSLADGVLFEFGPSRPQDLRLRSQIREWQPQLRMLFLMRITLFKYRLQLPGFELPKAVHVAQQEYDNRLAVILDRLANRMEGKPPTTNNDFEDARDVLENAARACGTDGPHQSIAMELKTFLALSRTAESLVTSLANEIERPKLGSSVNQP
jgi:multidrug resistance protein MdtO